jgi:hypothetical protein
MTMPPQPGAWGPGGQPPQPWGWGAPPPPKQNNMLKWLLAGVGVLLVIAITVGVTVIVMLNQDDGESSDSTAASGPPIASADDDGPVEIITSEPTCQGWMPARDAMARVQNSGWGDRDPDIAEEAWSPAQRAQYEAVANSLRETADQAVDFARQTPHRVVRELYEQFIAYSRAYADSVSSYTAKDNSLAQTSVAASYALGSICNSITEGSAAARSILVSPISAPADLRPPANPADADRVISSFTATCERLTTLHTGLVTDTEDWAKQDPNVPASKWSVDQRAIGDQTARLLDAFVDELENLAPTAQNPVFQDLASMAAVYLRTFADALATFEPADNYLFVVGTRANNVLVGACKAVG